MRARTSILALLATTASFAAAASADVPKPVSPPNTTIQRRSPPPAARPVPQARIDAIVAPVKAARIRNRGPGNPGNPPHSWKSFTIDPLHPTVTLTDDTGASAGIAWVDTFYAVTRLNPDANPPWGEWSVLPDEAMAQAPQGSILPSMPPSLWLIFPAAADTTYLLTCNLRSAASGVRVCANGCAEANVEGTTLLFAFNSAKAAPLAAIVTAKNGLDVTQCSVRAIP